MVEKYRPDAKYAGRTKAVAQAILGIQVPQGTLEIWSILAQGCGAADDAIDNTVDPNKRQEVTNGLIFYIEGSCDTLPLDNPDLLEFLGPVRSVYQTLPPQSQELLSSDLRIFAKVTEKVRHETDIAKYSRLRMLEGQLNMELFHHTASESMKSHANFSQYRRTINRMVRARNNMDASIDLKDDFAKGLTLIQPTLYNRAHLFKDAFVQVLRSIDGFNMDAVKNIFGLGRHNISS